MSDPMRLIDSDTNDFERLLLGAVAREQPSRWQRHRMRRAIWLTKFGILGTALNAFASFGPHGIGTILLSTSLIFAASSPIEPTHAADHSNHVPLAPIAVTARQESPELRTTVAAPLATTREQSPQDAQSATNDNATKQTRPGSSSSLSVSTRRGSELRDEIVLLDRARAALQQGQPARTLSAVDQYRSAFPRGAFDQEAAVLRMEALQALGNRTRAMAEANAFLARSPNSPHGERVRRVLAKNGTDQAN